MIEPHRRYSTPLTRCSTLVRPAVAAIEFISNTNPISTQSQAVLVPNPNGGGELRYGIQGMIIIVRKSPRSPAQKIAFLPTLSSSLPKTPAWKMVVTLPANDRESPIPLGESPRPVGKAAEENMG